MFLWTESTNNLLRYRLSPWESLDRVTVSILNQGGDLPLVPAGIVEDNGYIDVLLPISGYITVERAVKEMESALDILLLMERAVTLYSEVEKRMIPMSEILFLPNTILVDKDTGRLKLVCLPAVSKYGRKSTVKNTLLSLTASALTVNIEKGEYLLLFLRGLNETAENEAISFLQTFNEKVLPSHNRVEEEKIERNEEKVKKGFLKSLKEKLNGEEALDRDLVEFLETPSMNFEQWLEEN